MIPQHRKEQLAFPHDNHKGNFALETLSLRYCAAV
jgi:hypothetical protein